MDLSGVPVVNFTFIGSTTSGPISVTNTINPALFNTLHLLTPSTISSTGAGLLQIANLAAEGNAGVNLTNANTVGTLAGTTIGTPFPLHQ